MKEALKLAVDGLEKILCAFEKDGKFVMKSMIRNELFDEVNLLLKKSKKVLAQPVQNQFKPDYDTQAVLVEEQQRMGAEIVALHIEIDTLHKILITRAEQIVGLQDEIRNLTGEE